MTLLFSLPMVSLLLQDHENKIDALAKQWKLKINFDKSAQITFTLKKSPQDCPHLTMNNINIPIRTEIKYLVIILDIRYTGG